MTVENVKQLDRLVIPEKNIKQMVTALLDSGYWVKVEQLQDNKALILIRKDEN